MTWSLEHQKSVTIFYLIKTIKAFLGKNKVTTKNQFIYSFDIIPCLTHLGPVLFIFILKPISTAK